MNDEELIERIVALNYREFGANVGNDLKRIIIKKEDELERYKNIIDELEEYLKEEERINNGIIINLTSGNVAKMDAGVKNGVLDKVLDKLKELKGSDE